jgi:type II secretory pathway component PulJ
MRDQSAFTLIELMVAITLSLFVIGVTATVYMTTFAANERNLKSTRLNQELRAIMNLATSDLRRAGHWGFGANLAASTFSQDLSLSSAAPGAVNITGTVPSIFTELGKTVALKMAPPMTLRFVAVPGSTALRGTATITDPATASITLQDALPQTRIPAGAWTLLEQNFNRIDIVNAAGNLVGPGGVGVCVLYLADLNGDGLVTSNPMGGERDERLGFRINTADGSFERLSLTSGQVMGTADCMTNGRWEKLSDEQAVEITAFEVTNRSAIRGPFYVNLQVDLREIQLSVRGRLRGDISVERQLTQVVKLRNDRLVVLGP